MIPRSPTDPKPEIQGRALLLLQITWFKCTRKSSNELFNKPGVKDSTTDKMEGRIRFNLTSEESFQILQLTNSIFGSTSYRNRLNANYNVSWSKFLLVSNFFFWLFLDFLPVVI